MLDTLVLREVLERSLAHLNQDEGARGEGVEVREEEVEEWRRHQEQYMDLHRKLSALREEAARLAYNKVGWGGGGGEGTGRLVGP